MKAPVRLLLASAFALFSIAATVSASTVILWDMGDEEVYPGESAALAHVPTPVTHAPAIVPAGVSVADITRGPGLTATRLHHGFASSGWHSGLSGVPATLVTAMANGNWYEVSFTAQPGYELSFLSLDYRMRRSATADGRTTESIWQFSFDGFDTIAGSFGHYSMPDGTGAGNGITAPTVNLATIPSLQNLDAGTTVTMRFYAYDRETFASVTTSGNTFGFGRAKTTAGVILDEDLPWGGPVFTVEVIPEPSTYALILGGILLAGVTILRRRRKV